MSVEQIRRRVQQLGPEARFEAWVEVVGGYVTRLDVSEDNYAG